MANQLAASDDIQAHSGEPGGVPATKGQATLFKLN